MSPINFQHIVSCSSEDKVFKSENLLDNKNYRKWKCAHAGEKQAIVVLQLEKSTLVSSIDIGNEGSALVEVLVGKSSDTKQEFQILLATSSFMTPQESRQETNLNRVRMFDTTKLSQTVMKEKWDRVKVVCSQPFNKNIQFGLSFVRLNSSENNPTNEHKSPFGSFKIKEQPNEELVIGSWLDRHRNDKNERPAPTTGALAIRNASQNLQLSSTKEVIKPKELKFPAKKRQRGTGSTENCGQSSQPSLKILTNSENDKNSSKMPTKSPEVANQTEKRKQMADKKEEPKPKISNKNQNTPRDHQKPKDRKTNCPFNKIMAKVIFTLSGYQNPERGQLRDKALAMGATYKPDWNNECTHLMCAFKNTPKFNQVKAKGGKIVSAHWITACYKEKSLLPWTKYTLDKQHKASESNSSSEDSEYSSQDSDDSLLNAAASKNRKKAKVNVKPPETKPTNKTHTPKNNPKKQELLSHDYNTKTKNPIIENVHFLSEAKEDRPKQKAPTVPKSNIGNNSDADSVYLDSTDVDNDSDVDTEDEIMRVQNNIKKQSPPNKKKPTNGNVLPKLPDLFEEKTFYLYGQIPEPERRKLARYIIGSNGAISEYMNDNVNYVLTLSDWKEDFELAIKEQSVIILKPSWVFECIMEGKLVNAFGHMIQHVKL